MLLSCSCVGLWYVAPKLRFILSAAFSACHRGGLLVASKPDRGPWWQTQGKRDVVEPHLLSCNTSYGELHLHLCKSYFQVGRPEGRMFDIHHDYCPGSSSFFLCHVSLASSMLDLFAIQMNSDTRVMLKITWTELRRVFQNTKRNSMC